MYARVRTVTLVFGERGDLLYCVAEEDQDKFKKKFITRALWRSIVSRAPGSPPVGLCQRLRRFLWLTRCGKPCNRTGTRK